MKSLLESVWFFVILLILLRGQRQIILRIEATSLSNLLVTPFEMNVMSLSPFRLFPHFYCFYWSFQLAT